jgi:colanic acid/amylovoran biosynthesis glycosyltransferase
VDVIRLAPGDEPLVVALAGAMRDGLRLAARRPGRLGHLLRAARGSAEGRTPWPAALRRMRAHLPVVLARPDVVHVEWESAAVGLLPLFEALGCPVLVSSHGGIHIRPHAGDTRMAAAYPVMFARAAAVHCVSEAVRQEAMSFGLDPRRARVIRTAVDTDYFTPVPDGQDRPDGLRVVGVGELNWMKGYDDALRAVALLAGQGITLTYEIIGGEPAPSSGRPREGDRLRYLIKELGLEGRVRLLGRLPQERVRERLRAADVLLQASLSEGLPNTVLEAMACALPVVVTDCGGLREAVEHGVEGLVCPRRAPAELARALGALRDRRVALAMGQAGRARVCAQFMLAAQVDAFRRLYSELAAQG